MEKLGIEPVQFLTQLVNFTIMVVVLTKILYKPITKNLEERRKKIQEGLEYAEKMKMHEEENEKKRQEIIKEARDEARKIIEEGKKAGKKLEAEIVASAHREAESIIEKGRKDLEIERTNMESQIRGQAISIASAMAQKVLGSVLTDDKQREIIDKKLEAVAELAKNHK